MTQPLEAVGGSNDIIVAAEPTLEDRFAALGNTDQDEEKKPEDEPEPQGDGDDIDPELLNDAAEAEVAAEPPIAPPVSWTAEEKAEFADLPRALQETLSRRETEREKFVQTKAQEAKAIQQKVEQTARDNMAEMQNVHVQSLRALLPEIPPRPDPRLQPRDPDGYANQLASHEWAVAQHQQAQQLIQHIGAQQEAAEKAATQEQQAQDRALLEEQFPEFFDTAKGPELKRSLQSTALALGYSEDQLANVDARDVLAMKQASEWKAKADKLDTLMANKMQQVRDAKKLPKVSRPGVPLGKGALEGERYQSDRQAMNRGDRDAAARVFGRFL